MTGLARQQFLLDITRGRLVREQLSVARLIGIAREELPTLVSTKSRRPLAESPAVFTVFTVGSL
jgi:hypothetical protein